MRIGFFPVVLLALAGSIGLSGSAAEQNRIDHTKNPETHLRESCRHVCIEARTAQEVSKCVGAHETLQGSESFKKANPQCYQARQEYQASLEHHGLEHEPERYG